MPIKSSKASDDALEIGVMTLVTDAMVDNWDEFEGDSDEYGWVFAQPTTQLPLTAIKANKANNIQAKQMTSLNKVQGPLSPFWILLDKQLIVNVFYNTIFLQNIQKGNKELRLYTNAGISIIDEVGDLPGFDTVWLHRDGIANILSLHSVKSKGFQIDYNSTKEDEFVVTIQNGTTHKFTPSPNSLYYTDMLNEFQQRKNI